ncbi:hypothetical protein FB45DRAFT_1060766 [Roridomyces roridus]|uniref:DUF6534 domain-containing protein n=1 Tax=Roridomyces roridus TaxID=1738132 RepID=A0AAD7FK01_9AGAR|nr:hypothetical protein FB45DRAFT_1060766 [Roridomyces roridus]
MSTPVVSAIQDPAMVPTAAPDYAAIVTPQLIGSLLNFFFFGTLIVQTYIYRVCFPKDFIGTKFIVSFVLLLMTACICLNAVDVQFWFGAGFGDIGRFSDPRNSRIYIPLLGSFVAMVVQLFFCLRIISLKRSAWPLSMLIAVIGLGQCAGGMGASIISYMKNDNIADPKHTVFIYLWLIAAPVADILIAVTMTVLFVKTRKSDSSERDCLRSFLRFFLETNTFTAIVAVLSLVLYLGLPDKTFFACPAMILPGIYANTLLIALNHRTRADSTSISSGHTRVLNVPAVSYSRTPARRSDTTGGADLRHAAGVDARRSSIEKKWRDRDGEESESDYGSDAGERR